jgi:DNA-binding CsgD family transcriptional regulator
VDVSDFIERTNQIESAEDLFLQFKKTIEGFGFTKCLFAGGSTDLLFRNRYNIETATPIILNHYPESWTRHYLEKNYIETDPVFARIKRQWEPVIWDDIAAKKLEIAEKKVMNEACESGLHNGISIPLHGPDGDNFIISMASDDHGNLMLRRHYPYLRLISAQFFFVFNDLWRKSASAQAAIPHLTERERECLQWAAHGKSAWEIGTILHISEATVRFHLSNAFSKLKAQNRINAIVRGIRWGIISL